MKTSKNLMPRSFIRSQFSRFMIPGFLAGIGLVSAPLAVADSTSSPAQITIDADKITGSASPLILGQAMEAADSAGVFTGSVTQPWELESGNGFWDPEGKRPVPAIVEKCRQLRIGLMRYPGGSLANNYDWRKSVGPLASRGDWKFGLDEYLTVCRAIGAEPLITVSDYVLPAEQMPENNAQLVEYLNAPATPEHPWAEKRKEWGHEQPYGVKWFELGNESDNGNCDIKPHRQFTPEQYARYAIDCIRAMKAVDPSIKIGIVSAVGSIDPRSAWNVKVLHSVGGLADFTIVHEYAPSMGPNMPVEQESQLMQACMAEADQYEKLLTDYEQVIKDQTGKEMPLAITEYNAGFELDKPKPYRFSYGAALNCADLVRVFFKPENHVIAANYWQLLNGYWGMLLSQYQQPDGGQIIEKAAFPLYRLWGEHFGSYLLDVKVDGPTQSFPGFSSVLPAKGTTFQTAASLGFTTIDHHQSPSASGSGFEVQWTGPDSLKADFNNWIGDVYPPLGALKPIADKSIADCDYRLDFDARYVPTPAPGTEVMPLGLEIVDDRGWDKTGSIDQIKGIAQPEWHHFSGDLFHTLSDAHGLSFNAILATGVHKISGTMEIRNLKIEAFRKTSFPEYALLTSAASLSALKDKLYLIVFNKSMDTDLSARINLAGFTASAARLWQVNAPGLASIDNVREVASGSNIKVDGNGLDYVFPAHSMTAIEISK
jgi:alpha-N-arabinofuranosidase